MFFRALVWGTGEGGGEAFGFLDQEAFEGGGFAGAGASDQQDVVGGVFEQTGEDGVALGWRLSFWRCWESVWVGGFAVFFDDFFDLQVEEMVPVFECLEGIGEG